MEAGGSLAAVALRQWGRGVRPPASCASSLQEQRPQLSCVEKACSVSKPIKAPKWKNLLFFGKAAPGNNGGFVSQASWGKRGVSAGGRCGGSRDAGQGPGLLPTGAAAAPPLERPSCLQDPSQAPRHRPVGGHEAECEQLYSQDSPLLWA